METSALDYFKRNGTPIVAVATALGGPVAIVRVSGNNLDFLKPLVGKFPEHSSAALRKLRDRNDNFLDESLVLFFRAPHSFSGETVVEIQCHGVNALVEKIVNEIISLGAKQALAGEFSFRAVMNNKMTLDEASRLQSVFAQEGADAAYASKLLGASKSHDEDIQKIFSTALEDVAAARGRVEAAIDFAEAEMEQAEDIASAETRVLKLQKTLRSLLNTYELFVSNAKTPKFVLMGRPNAGKSTLLNLLCGSHRAIVSSVAGTTRDYVEVPLKTPKGRAFKILDTAGLWNSTNCDLVEAEGMKKSRELVEMADLVFWVSDVRDSKEEIFDEELSSILPKKDLVKIGTHADMLESQRLDGAFSLIGADAVAAAEFVFAEIEKYFVRRELATKSHDDVRLISQRQEAHLREALLLVDQVLECLSGYRPLELSGDLLREIEEALRKTMGESAGDEYIGQIFTQFCLGK